MGLSPVDAAILAAYLVGVVLFGLWVGRRQRDVSDFMVGGRDRSWWLVMFSIVATETSTVTFLSIPGFAFERDLTWIQLPLGFLIGRLVVVALLLPRYFAGRLFTSYQVLGERFGGKTQKTASLLFMVTRSLADGLRLFLTALVLQELLGLPIHWAVVVMGGATIIYTFAGGMKAVLWTDLVQFVVYILGAVVALFLLVDRIPGGLGQLLADAQAAGKLRAFDLRLDLDEPFVLWAGVLGGLFLTLGSHGTDQLMVQRYLCARDLRQAGRALWVSGVVVLLQFGLFLMIGVGLHAFYAAHPPAVPFDRADRVFVRFIVEELPVGALGLVLGAVFSAAMSTLSSSLNSSATAAVNDIYAPARPTASPRHLLNVTRAFTVFFGFVQIAVGIAGQWISTSVVNSVLAIAGFTTGLVLGLFFLGIFSQRVGQKAALVGLVVGLAGMSAVAFGTTLAWPWYSLVGSALTFAAGWLASFSWPRQACGAQ
jgi:solute:Na+ symporter, SSS family